MKKIFMIFCAMFFSVVSVSWGAYFYADDLEQAIQDNFPENLQLRVAEEYEAQMDLYTGEIDEQGIYNVCYVGGYDVNTDVGAKKCNTFVQQANPKREYTPPYTGPYNCDLGTYQNVSVGCGYASSGLSSYSDPKGEEGRLQKCIFDKTMDFVLQWEGGFQQTPSDPGNRICNEKGKALDEFDNVVTQYTTNRIKLGATKYGITTCSSKLSVECICVMSRVQASNYYWTHLFRGYGYYRLPTPLIAAVMQLSVAGVGTVATELKTVVGANCGKDTKITDCILEAVHRYMENHTVEDFYEDICNARAKKYENNPKKIKYYRRAIETKNLQKVYSECVNSLK